MIRFAKGNAPKALTDAGPAATNALTAAVARDPAAYASGAKKLSFSKAIYGHRDVVEQLRTVQNNKCCFCEVLIETPYMDEHVEHWRPKGSVKQLNGEQELRPGYYWLAYEWDNLFLACQVCNRNHKGSQFPVADPSLRARHPSHIQAFANERPQVLRPDGPLDPELHIIWKEDVPVGVTRKGRTTIEVLGLVRDLDPKRGNMLTKLRHALERLRKHSADPSPVIQGLMKEHRDTLRAAILPSAPHSAMAKAFLAASGPWQSL